MAGHSHFKNMMHRKGRVDKMRSKLFTKLSREITVSAKLGAPEPDMNPRLRAAVQAARAANMPKDNVERAIKKSQGNIDNTCLLYTSPSPRDRTRSRMPSSA